MGRIKGSTLSKEHKMKISNSMKGRTLTETHKQNISKTISKKGIKSKIYQYDKGYNLIKIWDSLYEISKSEEAYNTTAVHDLCNNKDKGRKSYKDCYWSYYPLHPYYVPLDELTPPDQNSSDMDKLNYYYWYMFDLIDNQYLDKFNYYYSVYIDKERSNLEYNYRIEDIDAIIKQIDNFIPFKKRG